MLWPRAVIVIPDTVTGYLDGGGTISQNFSGTGIISFDQNWMDLTKVDILFSSPSSGGFEVVFIDNINVPAAVWLFASGLAALGWLTCRPVA